VFYRQLKLIQHGVEKKEKEKKSICRLDTLAMPPPENKLSKPLFPFSTKYNFLIHFLPMPISLSLTGRLLVE